MSLRDSIKLILEDEVNKKYPKPTPNLEKLIYKWLDNYFSGAKMYHVKSWETRHDFEFCNRGKEILNVILFFKDDEGDWTPNEKPTEEREFDNGTINLPKNIVDEITSVIPVRRNYLRYVIEEWVEDNYLLDIQTKMKRKDISIDDFSEYPDDAKTCVPPMTKPDDVSIEDMIELIIANTLYNRKELEKKTPEWIEKTYLEKLRSMEMERVRR